MNNLSTKAKAVLNDLSQQRSLSVELGSIVAEVIENLPHGSVSPVNAVAATVGLTISGVVVHGEKLTVDNPAVVGGLDTYEFLTTVSQTPTQPSNIPVDISGSAVAATGTLTMDTQPTSGDTVTIGTKTYTFVPVGTDNGEGEVSIGADLAGAQAAFISAVKGLDGHNTANAGVTISDFVANVCTVTANIRGTVGNGIATTETFTAATNIFSNTHLASGTDCSATNAGTALVTAVTAEDTQGVSAVKTSASLVTFTADVSGADGNAILVSEGTMANGSFATPNLAGGIDGTVGGNGAMVSDSTYLYVAVAANTKAGANWRRISLGSVY